MGEILLSGLVVLNNLSGSWEIVNDELHAISHGTFLRLLTTADDAWEDDTIEFDVKPLKRNGIVGISLAVRVQEPWIVYCSISDPVIIIGDTLRFKRHEVVLKQPQPQSDQKKNRYEIDYRCRSAFAAIILFCRSRNVY